MKRYDRCLYTDDIEGCKSFKNKLYILGAKPKKPIVHTQIPNFDLPKNRFNFARRNIY